MDLTVPIDEMLGFSTSINVMIFGKLIFAFSYLPIVNLEMHINLNIASPIAAFHQNVPSKSRSLIPRTEHRSTQMPT